MSLLMLIVINLGLLLISGVALAACYAFHDPLPPKNLSDTGSRREREHGPGIGQPRNAPARSPHCRARRRPSSHRAFTRLNPRLLA